MALLLGLLLISCSVRSVQIERAENHYKKGQRLANNGEFDRAVIHFNKSINMARDVEFNEGLAHNLNELAIVYTHKQEYEKARKYLFEALEIYEANDMPAEISKTMNNIADTYTQEENAVKALKWFNRLIEWDTKTGNQVGVGITCYNMALIYHKQLNETDKAQQYLNQALKIFKETGNEKLIERIKNMQKRKPPQ